MTITSSSIWSRPRRKAFVVVVTVGLAVTASAGAQAAVTVVYQRGSASEATIYADGDRARIENPEREAQMTSVIIDATGKKMTLIDDRAKTYVEVTEEDLKRIRGQMAGMRAQLQERMKTMPPEQRKKMEEAMSQMGAGGGAGAGGEPAKPPTHTWKFEALGQKKTVNGIACQMYKVIRDGKPHEEDCISPWSAGLVKKSDFEGLRKFGEEMASGMGVSGAKHSNQIFEGIDRYPGVPITRVTLNDDGSRGEEEQIKSIKRDAIPASRFATPAGYTKKDFASMLGRGARQPTTP
jgi:hypothetical protein